jgi:excisionase family DNA binding protein
MPHHQRILCWQRQVAKRLLQRRVPTFVRLEASVVSPSVDQPFTLLLPDDAVQALAERVATLVQERMATAEGAAGWPAWMDVKAAASYLGCEATVVRKLIQHRKIRYSQEAPGCRIWIARLDLDTWLRGLQHDPVA